MSVQLDRWLTIQAGQRWVVQSENQMDVVENGTGSLAAALDHMAVAVRMIGDHPENRGRESKEKVEALSALAERKITQYESRHCWLYLFFMKIIGCHPAAAFNRFHVAVDNFIKLHKRTPQIESDKLAPLFQDRRFACLSARQRLFCTTAFIHLLPLQNSLGVSGEEIVNAIFGQEKTGFSSVNTAANVPMINGFLRLLKTKRNFSFPNDWKDICNFVHMNTNLKRLSYHGTNIEALKTIQKVGLGGDDRDYSLNEVRALYDNSTAEALSGLNPQTFYVTERASNAYGYANDSPEWLHCAERPVPQHILAKYNSSDAVILQIEMPRKANETPISFEGIEDIYAPNILEGTLLGTLEEKILGATFAPVKVSAYIVPKLPSNI